MQELEDRTAQDVEDFGVESREGTAAELRDDVVEGALPSERAGDDLAGERPIALVGQPRTRARASAWGRSACSVDTARNASYAASRAGAIIRARLSCLTRGDGRPETRARTSTRRPSGWSVEDAQHAAVARDDFESLRFGTDDGAWRVGTHGRRQRRAMDEDSSASDASGDERPRLKASHQVVDTLGRQRPVDGAFRFGDLGRVGHERRRPAASRWRVRRQSPARTSRSRSAPISARSRSTSTLVSSGSMAPALPSERGAGIELLHDPHDRDAGFVVAGDDRTMDGRGAAPSRQQRGVHVDHAERRNAQAARPAGAGRMRRQLRGPATERRDLTRGRPRLSAAPAAGRGCRSRRASSLVGVGSEAMAAAFGPVGLRDERDDFMTSGRSVKIEETSERRHRELRRPEVHDRAGAGRLRSSPSAAALQFVDLAAR